MSTHSKLKYPYNWGRDRVQPFVEKYARGTYNLARLVGIAPGLVRHMLIMSLCTGNSLRWEVMKFLIKDLCGDDPAAYRRLSNAERKQLYKYLLYSSENRVLDEKIAQKSLDMLRQRTLGL